MNRRLRPNFAYLDNGKFPIAFAHRGGDALGADIENTLKAFRSAYELGYRYMETDVILSADKKVVAIHGSKNPKEQARTGLPLRSILQTLEYEEIRRRYKMGGEDIPLLGDLFDEFDDIRVNIDPKTDEVVGPLGRLLVDRSLEDRVGIGSFSYKRTKGVAEILGGQDRVCTAVGRLGAVASKARLAPYLSRTQAACLQLPYEKVSESMVSIAHDQGMQVHVWTVNEVPRMHFALTMHVNGIMADNVIGLKEVMQSRGQWPEAA